MYRKWERGFSFVEFMMVATVVSFVSTGVKTFVFDRGKAQTPQIASNDVAGKGRASVDQMVHELELAGYSQRTVSQQIPSGPFQLASTDPAPAAGPFLVAKPDQVIFEADLKGDGNIERVEYRLYGSAIWRRVVPANQDDAAAPAEYEMLTEYVDNGDAPLFRYARDPYSNPEKTAGIRAVWVTLQLRPPVTDSKRPQFRTLRFDGLAQCPVTENTVPMAELQ